MIISTNMKKTTIKSALNTNDTVSLFERRFIELLKKRCSKSLKLLMKKN